MVELLLDTDADANLEDNDRMIALLYATKCPAVMWLLKYGTATEARAADHLDNTQLIHVAWLGDLQGAKILLDQGVDINAMNKYHETTLTEATRHGDVDVVALLLDHDLDLEFAAAEVWTPLLQAARDNKLDGVATLPKHGAKVDAKLKYSDYALVEARARGHLDIAQLLIETGSNINGTDGEHLTPSLRAAYRGSVEVNSPSLLPRGTNVEVKDEWGCTLVHKAAEDGHKKTLKVLLEYGANPYKSHRNGFTIVLVAANKVHIKYVERLLAASADLNVGGHLNYAALTEAAHHGRAEIAQLLISRGADFEITQYQDFHPCALQHTWTGMKLFKCL